MMAPVLKQLRAPALAGTLVDGAAWADVGEQLLGVLTALKHNGAIEKAQAGFHALCARRVSVFGRLSSNMTQIGRQI